MMIAQLSTLSGVITNELNEPQPYVHITLADQYGTVTELDGSLTARQQHPQ